MKKLFKMFATILAVSVLTIGFASCANDSSDSSSATVSATYKYESGNDWRKIILYSDASVAYARSDAAEKVTDGIIKKGSYVKTGDSFSSCTIEITWKEQRSQTSPYAWGSTEGSSTLTVSNGSCTFDDKTFTLSGSNNSSSNNNSSSTTTDPAAELTKFTSGAKAKFVYDGSKEFDMTAEMAAEISKELGTDLTSYAGKKVKINNPRYFVFTDSEYTKADYSKWTCEGKTIYHDFSYEQKGTFTITDGDFTAGTLATKCTHDWDKTSKAWKEANGSQTITIAGGKFTWGSKEYTKQ